MNIFVTGATGFLGKKVCSALELLGHNVVGVGSKACDLTHQDALKAYSHTKWDQIYHLAAWTQAGDFCLKHPSEQWVINQKINTNLLTWWLEDQPQAKLIAMGTSCAYNCDAVLKEENYLMGPPVESLFSYAMTKRMLLCGLQVFAKQHQMKYLYLVPSTLYGSGYHTGERQMHFIFDLIRKILRGKHFGDPVVLWGDGHQKRELVLIDDFVKIMFRLVEQEENKIINIGAGEEFSIRHFASLISDQLDYDFNKIEFDTSRYVGVKSKCLDTQKFKTILPNYRMTDLKEGLKETIHWFLENPQVYT